MSAKPRGRPRGQEGTGKPGSCDRCTARAVVVLEGPHGKERVCRAHAETLREAMAERLYVSEEGDDGVV